MEEDKLIIITDLMDIGESEAGYTDEELSALARAERPITWAKFILTDDQPNANKVRIPKEEFSNLVETGVLMPIKMKLGKIDPTHNDASPLGVIASLKEEGDRVYGIAALWDRERPGDIELIKQKYKNKEPLQLSWEVLYSERQQSASDEEVQDLRGVTLRAVTLVGLPSYKGRTPIYEIASTKEDVLDELEKLTVENSKLKGDLTNIDTLLQEAKASLDKSSKELDELREFKASVEKREADEKRLKEIKSLFENASIEKSDEFYTENAALLLSMDDTALGFFVGQLSEVAATKNTSEDLAAIHQSTKTKIPAIVGDLKTLSPKDIGKALRAIDKTK